jgi:hypothetical protein
MIILLDVNGGTQQKVRTKNERSQGYEEVK